MAPTRHFRNTLPDHQGPSSVPADETSPLPQSPDLTTPKSALLPLFQETLTAVQGYRTSNPTIYTGSSGVAFALWHAYRSLSRQGSPAPTAAVAAASTTAAPAGPAEALIPADLPAALLSAALERSRDAAQQLKGPRAMGLTHGSRAASMLDGAAGVHMTAALVLHDAATAATAAATGAAAAANPPPGTAVGSAAAGELQKERDFHVRAYLDAYPAAMDSETDEYLYGRAGYLQGALLLNSVIGDGTIPPEVVEGVATEILESGRELAGRVRWRRSDTPQPPLFYVWHDEPYMGAAHGMIGILFTLLHCRPVVQQNAQELRACLTYVASHEMDAAGCSSRGGHYPTRMSVTPLDPREEDAGRGGKVLVHWCHGAPGAVFMWCKAHEVFGDAAYLAAAERAGEVVWQLGLLRKGHGLCHGTSGNAYALLALHRATGGDPRWLHRVRMFAAHVGSQEGRSVYDTPDRPLSLFEGRAATLCLLADLLAEDGGSRGARFPAFELP